MFRSYSMFFLMALQQGEGFLNNRGVNFCAQVTYGFILYLKKKEENKYLDVFLGFNSRIIGVFSGEVVHICIMNR